MRKKKDTGAGDKEGKRGKMDKSGAKNGQKKENGRMSKV